MYHLYTYIIFLLERLQGAKVEIELHHVSSVSIYVLFPYWTVCMSQSGDEMASCIHAYNRLLAKIWFINRWLGFPVFFSFWKRTSHICSIHLHYHFRFRCALISNIYTHQKVCDQWFISWDLGDRMTWLRPWSGGRWGGVPRSTSTPH
jgi:hypothetical protein